LGTVNTPHLDGFAMLAQKGPAWLLPECVRAVQQQAYFAESTRLLEAAGNRWIELRNDSSWNMTSGLSDLLRYLSSQGRKAVLTGFAPFLPAVHHIAGPEQILHMTRSIHDAVEWWP